ncbi:MAG: phage tail protein I, partial [Pseudogulbenkiania sp.]|nr:phage tail protein I [Pseudogulbenkiania sp.]
MSAQLLPPNRTALEAALADILTIDLDPSVIRTLWDSDRCPSSLLPWLAWAVSVDSWELANTDADRRALIRRSIELHRHKGTAWAAEEA